MFICMLHCIVNNVTNAIAFHDVEMLAMQKSRYLAFPKILQEQPAS